MLRLSRSFLVLVSLTAAGVSTPAPEEPPPFECPLCGNDPVVHQRRMSAIALLDGYLVRTALAPLTVVPLIGR